MATANPSPAAAMSSPSDLNLKTGVFKLAGDPVRFTVLEMLRRGGEVHVTSLCEALRCNQPALSHHLALLRLGRLIESRREGKHNYYSLTGMGDLVLDLADQLVA